MTYSHKKAVSSMRTFTLWAVLGCSVAFFVAGLLVGRMQVENAVINEINSWHTARMYEDGSWQVEYKDKSTNAGCIETGLCQD